MSRFSRRALAALALAILILPAFAGIASAEHAYSHRYIVYGKLLDENGDPIVGERVQIDWDESVPVEGGCGGMQGTGTDAWEHTQTTQATNEYGEFMYCLHTHSIGRGNNGQFHLTHGNTTESVPVDVQLRKNFVTLQVPGDAGEATEAFQSTYLVSGRVFYEATGSVRVEGVTVYGDVVGDADVTVTFIAADGTETVEETKTNRYGDFAVRVPVEDVEGGRVRVEALDKSYTYNADPVARGTEELILVDDPNDRTQMILMTVGGLAGAAVIVGGGAFMWRRVSENREIAKARATSTRKRARR